MEFPRESPDFNEQRGQYRQRWLDVIAANPAITRNELRLLESKADQWLHLYDADWLEQNSPLSKKALPSWVDCDDEYLKRVENAVKQIRGSPGMPRRISILSVGREAGIIKPYIRLVSDLLPKTKNYVSANIETLEQWQKRKIRWVVRQMSEQGEILTVYKVRHAARIEDKPRKLDEFILMSIKNSE